MHHPIDRALSIADLRRIARRRLPRAVFEFIDGGAEDELTLADNRAAFERRRIVRRVLVDVSSPRLETKLLGATAGAPLVVAPMGSCALAWPGADLMLARAAARRGLPYTLSTMANTALEAVAEQAGGRLWFQLYVLADHDFNYRLIDRAAAAGYEALVVTVDLQAGGKRERDLRNGISIPLRPGPRLALDVLRRPGWAWRTLRAPAVNFENVRELMDRDHSGLSIAAKVGRNLDAGFDWAALARIRERWQGKLLVKGVEHPGDAARLAAEGVDAVWVSNHGGRQLDGAVASADALARIAPAVAGRCELIVDSGVRRGVDILKARALGARAVAVGRAALYGAAAAGQAGADRALQILTDELELAMKLAGVADTEAVQGLLAEAPGPGVADCARPAPWTPGQPAGAQGPDSPGANTPQTPAALSRPAGAPAR